MMAPDKVNGEKRCPSGIEGLDRIMCGGFPTGGVIHVAGSCGSGKTSLALEFLVRGANEGQKSLFIVTDRSPETVLDSVVRLNIFDERMVKDKTLRLIDIESILEDMSHPRRPIDRNGAMEIVSEIETLVQKQGIKRLAIDPVTPLILDMEPGASRDFIKKLSEGMRRRGCTTILTSNCEDHDPLPLVPADGAVRLMNIDRHGNNLRVLQVMKMAGVQHSRSKYVFEITPCGILATPLIKGGRF